MHQELIFYPVIAMVMLTAYVGIRMLTFRFRAVRQDSLNPAYFLLMRGARPPEYMVKVERHYANLFEQPVLFYIAIILVYVTKQTDLIYLALGWLYFLSRLGHMQVHTTYNNLKHRRYIFLASTTVLFTLWIRLCIQLLTA